MTLPKLMRFRASIWSAACRQNHRNDFSQILKVHLHWERRDFELSLHSSRYRGKATWIIRTCCNCPQPCSHLFMSKTRSPLLGWEKTRKEKKNKQTLGYFHTLTQSGRCCTDVEIKPRQTSLQTVVSGNQRWLPVLLRSTWFTLLI